MVIDTTRLSWVDQLKLDTGNHRDPDHGACVMEAVAYITGEPWSDHPQCASPVLGAFLRAWNDGLDDETRQRLKPYVPRLVGTAGDAAVEERRAWMATDWLVRVCAPAFLDLARLTEEAESYRQLPEIVDGDVARDAQATISSGRETADAAGDVARAAARDAARDALKPTVTSLQESAFDLVEAMIEAKSAA